MKKATVLLASMLALAPALLPAFPAAALPPLPIFPHSSTVIVNLSQAQRTNLMIDEDGAASLRHLGRFWGSEITVNSPVGSLQLPNVAPLDDERFVVVWSEVSGGTVGSDILGRFVDVRGNKISDQFIVCNALVDQYFPAVATNSKGEFLVAWSDYRTHDSDIYAQRFDHNGTKLGSEIAVSTGHLSKYRMVIAADAKDCFVLAWVDTRDGAYQIYAEVLDRTGATVVDEFPVSSGSTVKDYPSLATDSENRFVIAWHDYMASSDMNIKLQRLDSGGNKVGSAVTVAGTPSSEYMPAVAMGPGDTFIVAWADNRTGKYEYYWQKFDRAGNKVGAELKLTDTEDLKTNTRLSIGPEGDTLLVWKTNHGGSYDLCARLFSWAGAALTPLMLLASDATAAEDFPATCCGPAGHFMASWRYGKGATCTIRAQPFILPHSSPGTLVTDALRPDKLWKWSDLEAASKLGNPGSNTLTFEYSTDGGATYKPILAGASLAAAGDRPVRVKSTFSTIDNITTPLLSKLALDYTWNTPPAVSVQSEVRLKRGATVNITANGTDPDLFDALTLDYKWTQTNGTPLTGFNSSAKNLTFRADRAGNYVFSVVATDGYNDSAPAHVNLTITEEKKAEGGLPVMTILLAAVVVVIVMVLLAALLMRKKPTTVIQYQPPPAAPPQSIQPMAPSPQAVPAVAPQAPPPAQPAPSPLPPTPPIPPARPPAAPPPSPPPLS